MQARDRRNLMGRLCAGAAASVLACAATAQSPGGAGAASLLLDIVETSSPSGREPTIRRDTLALRRDGSQVRATQVRLANGNAYELREIHDLSTGRHIFVNTGSRTTTTLPLRRDLADRATAGASGNCGLSTTARRSTIMGYEAIHESASVRGAVPDGEVAFERERWLAPALGCVSVQMTVRENGRVVSSQTVENIRLGEPDSPLFHIPAGYVEASPAEVSHRLNQMLGGPAPNPAGLLESLVQQAYADRAAGKY